MLVLTRRINEKVYLQCPGGYNVEIMVTAIKADGVRLGFTAPTEVQIVRDDAGEQHAKSKRRNRN